MSECSANGSQSNSNHELIVRMCKKFDPDDIPSLESLRFLLQTSLDFVEAHIGKNRSLGNISRKFSS